MMAFVVPVCEFLVAAFEALTEASTVASEAVVAAEEAEAAEAEALAVVRNLRMNTENIPPGTNVIRNAVRDYRAARNRAGELRRVANNHVDSAYDRWGEYADAHASHADTGLCDAHHPEPGAHFPEFG